MTVLALETVKTSTMKECVAYYNETTGKSIRKFRDLNTARARVTALLLDAQRKASLPDETIKPEDEEQLAAALDREETPQPKETEMKADVKQIVKPVTKKTQSTANDNVGHKVAHDAQKTTMKLDRRIVAYEGPHGKKIGQWANAHQMWKENQSWMTSAQQDALTAKLYGAAKQGEKISVEINGRKFQLMVVPELVKAA